MTDPNVAVTPTILTSALLADDSELIEIVSEFVCALDQRIADIKSAHADLDWSRIAMLAHQLKGAAGSYGFPDITSAARSMEDDFRVRKTDHFAEQIKHLQSLAAAARAGLD